VDYPALWAYARDLYQTPGVAGTWHPAHAIAHYHRSHETINPYGIVPIGPVLDWDTPHGRERLRAA
jgi:putative glutathione S-transferase